MDSFKEVRLEKYFRIVFLCVLVFGVIFTLYYHFVYVPKKKQEFILQYTPKVVEERSFLTPAENTEMRAAYEEIMAKKYKKTGAIPSPASLPISGKKQ